MPYTFPTSSIAEPFYNPGNPDYLSRRFRAQYESGSFAVGTLPTSSQLTTAEYEYFYSGSDTK